MRIENTTESCIMDNTRNFAAGRKDDERGSEGRNHRSGRAHFEFGQHRAAGIHLSICTPPRKIVHFHKPQAAPSGDGFFCFVCEIVGDLLQQRPLIRRHSSQDRNQAISKITFVAGSIAKKGGDFLIQRSLYKHFTCSVPQPFFANIKFPAYIGNRAVAWSFYARAQLRNIRLRYIYFTCKLCLFQSFCSNDFLNTVVQNHTPYLKSLNHKKRPLSRKSLTGL